MSSEDVISWTDRLAVRAAGTVTRRRLLRNTAAVTLGATLGGALVRSPAASARGTSDRPCGPSPLCPSGRCYNGQCSNAAGRYYDTYTCAPNQPGGCWYEDYRYLGKGYWKCCDCCAFDGGGTRCSGCNDGRARYACICRKRIA